MNFEKLRPIAKLIAFILTSLAAVAPQYPGLFPEEVANIISVAALIVGGIAVYQVKNQTPLQAAIDEIGKAQDALKAAQDKALALADKAVEKDAKNGVQPLTEPVVEPVQNPAPTVVPPVPTVSAPPVFVDGERVTPVEGGGN